MSYTTLTSCRICDNADRLTDLFSLGKQYISNFTNNPYDEPEEKCPIDLVLCPKCGLVQLKHTAPQEILYNRFYWYRSGVTKTMRTALRDITRDIESLVDFRPGDVVLDIGSNDGTLLRSYVNSLTLTNVGVEPAKNLLEEGSRGVTHFISDFWGYDKYWEVVRRKARVITAIGMFYDLENPNQFIADVARALAPDGLFVAQLMCLKNMLVLGDVGNLCHEHLEFYSLKTLEYMLDNHGLEIFDLKTNNVNGESYRLFIRHIAPPAGCLPGIFPNVNYSSRLALAEFAEQQMNLEDPRTFYEFYNTIKNNCDRLTDYVRNANKVGESVWIYGASTKGNVLLQWAGLDSTMIRGASERSPEKWGKYTIGTNIPIYSEDYARRANPNYFLVLPYAFINEFVNREQDWLRGGGKFIVPLPELHLIWMNEHGQIVNSLDKRVGANYVKT